MSGLLKNIALMTRRASRGAVQRSSEYSDTYFIDNVMSEDSKPEAARVGGEYLHVSSLIGMCLRKHVLAYSTKVERSNSVGSGMRIVWALGRAAEAHVRGQFVEAMNHQSILGVWKCKCGHLKVNGLYDDTLKCPKCDKKAKQYTEYALFDHEFKIVGSPDMVYVRPDNNKIMVVECKSINKKDYDELTKPKTDHVHQAVAYNELLRKQGGDVDDSVTIVYVCKDFSFKGPYKEFRVARTKQINDDIDSMWRNAKEYADECARIKEGKKPSYPKRLKSCVDNESTTAKSCDFCGICFATPNG
jgi:hypothetical protein